MPERTDKTDRNKQHRQAQCRHVYFYLEEHTTKKKALLVCYYCY